jgi:predicted MFS family arabinose efflux permease
MSHLFRAGIVKLEQLSRERGRLATIVLLAAVLGLDNADKGTVSAVAGELKQAFAIGNMQIGLLLSIVSFVGALATLPMGALADRYNRRTFLVVVVALWSGAMLITGFATSFLYLLVVRVALGSATAAAWPCTASLVGDFFAAAERARIFGLIIAGELLGVGVGFFISGEVSSWLGWRWSFFAMALPGLPLTYLLWRYLPEPGRGAQQWLRSSTNLAPGGPRRRAPGVGEAGSKIAQLVREQHVQPRHELVLAPQQMPRTTLRVLLYLLHLPTYRLLIIASALVYYFFAGIRSFAMIYATGHYHLSRRAVSSLVFVVGIAALAGVVGGGLLSRRLSRRGNINERIKVPAVALLAAVPLFGGGIWASSPWIAIPLLAAGVAAMGAALAPIDAARLDIVPAAMWGRGEAGRVALRSLLEGGAPLLFGVLSGWLGGGTAGLMWTFLLMLVPMLIAGSLALPAMRTYPIDVATAAASASSAPARRASPAG